MTKLIDTEASHFLNAIEHKQAGNSTHHYLRRLHNYGMYLGWLISPVMAEAAWPAMRKKKFTAITEEEHERIVAKEGNTERRLYYQMLWETEAANRHRWPEPSPDRPQSWCHSVHSSQALGQGRRQ